MRRFLFMAGERESQGQGADTAAVHVDNQYQFGHPVPVGAFAGGEAACGECRGGFEQGGQQLHIGLHHREQEAGNGDECQRQQQDGGCPFHQRGRDGFVVEFNVFFTLYRGDNGFDDDEQRGGLDAAAGGARRTANENHHQYK